MKLKDWLCPLYEFGVHPTGNVDIAHRGDDLLTNAAATEAVELMRRVNAYIDAVWWLYDRSSPETQDAFVEYVQEKP